MNKNTDDKQIVMDRDIFLRFYASLDKAVLKHVRKFNPHIRELFDGPRTVLKEEFKRKRQKVLDLTDRHGKIVYLVRYNPTSDDELYQPMLLIGKDHQNKLRLRLRTLLYGGLRGAYPGIKSYPIDKIARTIPEDYVYWTDGPNIDTFAPPTKSEFKAVSKDEYLKQWAERIR